MPGMTVGTPYYISPEQVADKRGLVVGTIGAHMQRLISRGLITDIDPYVPPETRAVFPFREIFIRPHKIDFL
jgi:hypothetical protein